MNSSTIIWPLKIFMALLCIYILICTYYLSRYHLSNIEQNKDQLHAEYRDILEQNPNLFVLEPALLMEQYVKSDFYGRMADLEEIDSRIEHLPQHWVSWFPSLWNLKLAAQQRLTLGVFPEHFNEHKLHFGSFKQIVRITGFHGLFDDAKQTEVTHLFYSRPRPIADQFGETLHLHLVVLHRVRRFFWVGPISRAEQAQIRQAISLQPPFLYGQWEQSFELFQVTRTEDISFPHDIPHLLAQLHTSKYLCCSLDHNADLFSKRRIDAIDLEKRQKFIAALVGIKGLMRKLKMEFWIVSWTLLGWRHKCDVIPPNLDLNFATWSEYALREGQNLTELLLTLAPRHKLQLWHRAGDPQKDLEFSFRTISDNVQLNLTFTYPNKTHYRLPEHQQHQDSRRTIFQPFVKYELCSIELFGYKLLAPCSAEAVIATEFGLDWRMMVS